MAGGLLRARGPRPLSAQGHDSLGLAPDDLRDALVTHAHDLGNGFHGQTLAVSRAYRFVPLLPEGFVALGERCFALVVGLCKGDKARSGLGCLAFRSGDLKIV
jgi:hypothetical protein